MKQFRHLELGHIEEPSEALEEQYTSRPHIWEEVIEVKTNEVKTPKTEKGQSYKELKETAQSLGIEFSSNVKKEELIELIELAKANA